MHDGLELERQRHAAEMQQFMQNIERDNFLKIKLINLDVGKKFTSFQLRKGFESSVTEVKVSIFIDGLLHYATSEILTSNELNITVKRITKELPLTAASRVRIIVADKDTTYNLYLLNIEDKVLVPITENIYLVHKK